jgi:CRP-like cAMP-binding protein
MATGRSRPFNPKSFLASVGNGQSITTYAKDQIVFNQGDAANAVFYIQRGKVKISVVSEEGKEAVVRILGASEFFGEGCLAGQTRRIATASSLAPCTISRLQKAAILRVIHEEPAFAEVFIAHLLGRSIRVEADLIDQLFNSSEKRLARVLLLMANYGKEGKTEPIVPKLSQETLAEMIGTTRSRVSFFMNKFRRLGFIDYNGGIEVHNSLLTVVLSHRAVDHSGVEYFRSTPLPVCCALGDEPDSSLTAIETGSGPHVIMSNAAQTRRAHRRPRPRCVLQHHLRRPRRVGDRVPRVGRRVRRRRGLRRNGDGLPGGRRGGGEHGLPCGGWRV